MSGHLNSGPRSPGREGSSGSGFMTGVEGIRIVGPVMGDCDPWFPRVEVRASLPENREVALAQIALRVAHFEPFDVWLSASEIHDLIFKDEERLSRITTATLSRDALVAEEPALASRMASGSDEDGDTPVDLDFLLSGSPLTGAGDEGGSESTKGADVFSEEAPDLFNTPEMREAISGDAFGFDVSHASNSRPTPVEVAIPAPSTRTAIKPNVRHAVFEDATGILVLLDALDSADLNAAGRWEIAQRIREYAKRLRYMGEKGEVPTTPPMPSSSSTAKFTNLA